MPREIIDGEDTATFESLGYDCFSKVLKGLKAANLEAELIARGVRADLKQAKAIEEAKQA